MSPDIRKFMTELNRLRKSFQDVGNAVHGSALQEVEQEREVPFEVEAVREVQKPVHSTPLIFPGLSTTLVAFVKTGRLAAGSTGCELVFIAMGRTAIGRKYSISGNGTSSQLPRWRCVSLPRRNHMRYSDRTESEVEIRGPEICHLDLEACWTFPTSFVPES